MKTTTINTLVDAKRNPPPAPVVQKVMAYCDKMKFGKLMKSRFLEEELHLTEFALNGGGVSSQLREYRYKTRETNSSGESVGVAYYGSRNTIKTLLSELAKLEGNQ
jgi:hypothetical protein